MLCLVSARAAAETIVVTATDMAQDAVSAQSCGHVYGAPALTFSTLSPDGVGGHVSPCEAPGISLVEASCAANTEAGADTIVLEAGGEYVLGAIHDHWYGPTGLPPIFSDVTIEGQRATIRRDPSAPPLRLFVVGGESTQAGATSNGFVAAPGTLTLREVTLEGGLAVGGRGGHGVNPGIAPGGGGAGFGGAVFNAGTLRIERSLVTGSIARGGAGGGRSGGIPAGGGGGGCGARYAFIESVGSGFGGQRFSTASTSAPFGTRCHDAACDVPRFCVGAYSHDVAESGGFGGGGAGGASTSGYTTAGSMGGFGGGGGGGVGPGVGGDDEAFVRQGAPATRRGSTAPRPFAPAARS